MATQVIPLQGLAGRQLHEVIYRWLQGQESNLHDLPLTAEAAYLCPPWKNCGNSREVIFPTVPADESRRETSLPQSRPLEPFAMKVDHAPAASALRRVPQWRSKSCRVVKDQRTTCVILVPAQGLGIEPRFTASETVVLPIGRTLNIYCITSWVWRESNPHLIG